MRTIKNYSGWIAEEIVKTYLLETGLLDISVPSDRKFDFVAISKSDFSKVIAIEVKASKYSKSEIIREYRTLRESFAKIGFPVIMFYINYLDKTGLIEIINKTLTDTLILLSRDNLINEIEKITAPNNKV